MIDFPVPITTLYAGLCGLLGVLLAANVGRVRGKTKTMIGDGNNEEMLRAIRVQGNYVEYAPFVLIMLLTLELMGAGALLLHILGATFVVARILHAQGLSASSGASFGRGAGTMGTLLVSLVAAGFCIYYALI